MSRPIVFISHSMGGSHKTDDRSATLKKCLIEALKNCGWEVFSDSIIEPGHRWRLEILDGLVKANAGIVLFNENAIVSDWVTSETTVLCFRKALDLNFPVIPVFLNGIRRDNPYFKRYAPFQLLESQCVDDCKESEEVFAKKIAKSLEPYKAQKIPTSEWIKKVEKLLKSIDVDYLNDLQEAAEKMGLDLSGNLLNEFANPGLKKACLIRNMAEFMHHISPLDSFKAFRELANILAEIDAKKVDRLGKHLRVKWVDNVAMEIILYGYSKPEDYGLLTLSIISGEGDIDQSTILQEYIDRANEEAGASQIWAFPVAGGAGEGDAVKFQIEKTICDEIVKPLTRNCDMSYLPDVVDKTIKELEGSVLCVIPQEYAKEKTCLKELRIKYPRIVFLVYVGANESNQNLLKDIGGKTLPELDETKIENLRLLISGIESCIKKGS
jgi:hypothetical protein